MNGIAQYDENRVSVLIADEHPAAREGLAHRLEQDGFRVCEGVGDVPGLLRALVADPPRVLVFEIALQSGSGLGLLKTLRANNPKLHVLVWSRYRETAYADR